MARILLVDDDRDQLEIRKLILEAAGHEVYESASRQAAETLLTEVRPQIAILDLRLPRLADGLSLLRRVRELLPETRTLVLSGLASDLENAKEAAMADVVFSKPVEPRNLLLAVARLETGRKQAAGASGWAV